MRIVVDTNVFVSGVFFSGPPHRILEAWRSRTIDLVLSSEILDEYERVGRMLALQFSGVDLSPFLQLLATHAHLVKAAPMEQQICTDPDDDMFLACALAGHVRLIVTGDRALLNASGYHGIRIVRPRTFVSEYL